MIHPSYAELMKVINEDSLAQDEAPIVSSRYSIVLATSKRARQLIAGNEPLVSNSYGKKALSVAVEELYKGKVKITSTESAMDDNDMIIPEDDE